MDGKLICWGIDIRNGKICVDIDWFGKYVGIILDFGEYEWKTR